MQHWIIPVLIFDYYKYRAMRTLFRVSNFSLSEADVVVWPSSEIAEAGKWRTLNNIVLLEE
jgi:RNase P protein component